MRQQQTNRTRVIIHPGFHKTGTTSLQALLRDNRDLIHPHVLFALKWRFIDLTHAAKGFSTWRDDLTLLKFAMRFAGLLNKLPPRPSRIVLISCEELSGHLPGNQGLADYSAAPLLAREMVTCLEERFGEYLDLTFLYTTRAAEPWLQSAYRHHVARTRLRLDYADYLEQFGASADFAPVLEEIGKTLTNHRLIVSKLDEHVRSPFGPAQTLVDLLDFPDEILNRLKPVLPRNTGVSEQQLQELLAINRSDLPADDYRSTKQAALDKILI